MSDVGNGKHYIFQCDGINIGVRQMWDMANIFKYDINLTLVSDVGNGKIFKCDVTLVSDVGYGKHFQMRQ